MISDGCFGASKQERYGHTRPHGSTLTTGPRLEPWRVLKVHDLNLDYPRIRGSLTEARVLVDQGFDREPLDLEENNTYTGDPNQMVGVSGYGSLQQPVRPPRRNSRRSENGHWEITIAGTIIPEMRVVFRCS